MQEYEADCVVVGAGVVGLAVARALAGEGREVLVIEAQDRIGTGISSRNSEVIHAGLYYPPGSLKARFCVRGRALLYEFAARAGVAHRKCGKLIVAADRAQSGDLHAIMHRARANGVDDIYPMTGAQARALERELVCAEALMSPSTGIIDAQSLLLALRHDGEEKGMSIAFGTEVASGAVEEGGVRLVCEGRDPCVVKAAALINAAGLSAPALAHRLAGFPAEQIPKAYWAKGNYFTLTGASPFSRLVYPAPEPGGLGVHLTLDLAGQARFGPDVEWVDQIDYRVDPGRGEKFYAAIRKYWPGLRDGALAPGYAGVRPKIVPQGAPDADFRILGPKEHGKGPIVHLFGIESPGLTASLAIGEFVADMINR